MNNDIKDLIKHGEKLFSQKQPLNSLHQVIAENFYPERASFTRSIYLGEEFGTNLTSSYPTMCRRDLGNVFSSMLRPTNKDWFSMYAEGAEKDHESKAWLEWATKVQKRIMYERRSQFVRAAKEGDMDFATFGQTVITVEMHPAGDGLLYRCWHLKDVAWSAGADGAVECVFRKWKTTGHELKRLYGEAKLHPRLLDKMKQDPFCEVECMHMVVPGDMYQPGGKKYATPLVTLAVDLDHEHVMQELPTRISPYVIPRWATLSDSQYAYSPAINCALPDARLLQAITLTLLEAGEKAVNPPLVAVQDAIRGDIGMYAGAITIVDAGYDERSGAALRALEQKTGGFPVGMEMVQDTRIMLRTACFLDKLDLPTTAGDMTAYEVSQRVQEFIRNALPLFEPAEVEFNGGLCEKTFELALMNGAFGPLDKIPRGLAGRDVDFKFVSPLHEAVDKQKGQVFLEASQILASAQALDPSAGVLIDAEETLRDVLSGIGVPTKWTRSPEMVAAIKQSQAQQAANEQALANMAQAAGAIKDLRAGNAAPMMQ